MSQPPPSTSRLLAEFLGTLMIVFGGCGSVVLAAAFPEKGIGLTGIALAFGCSVIGAAYAFGPVSGGHFNPAVTVGAWLAGRFPARDIAPYVVAQLLGAVLGAAVLAFIASGNGTDALTGGLGANGYGVRSPGGYGIVACFVAEVVLTLLFVLVCLGATDRRAPAGFGGLATGFALMLVHLVGIPVTGTSVNPARSAGPALVSGGESLMQLWLFCVAPLVGALLAGLAYRALVDGDEMR